ncbi:PREDICTED: perforin-1-like [Gekko japonicus]|uniref:Perforin-1-like n=1 Tax=Gekko japonicus TaxID=146911 RepID=A0ABM1JPR2_GEKJA|nr:PREDICTED: perforin-1-like [Gekko japonicus]
MSGLRFFFLAASLGFLSLLKVATSSHCQVFPNDDCQKSTSFVPGHNLIGEGLDITTLRRKGASVVDTSQWRGPNGTCNLCRNPLMDREMQRLPLAAVGWRVHSKCDQRVATSVEHSVLGVANAMTTEVTDDWKADLELPAIQAAFGGSRSPITLRAQEYSRRDSYSFIKHETFCTYYRLGLPPRRPLLASHFSHDVSNLPKEYHQKEYQGFINIYGTHYVSQVELGAQRRHLYFVQNCAAALGGLTVFDLENCLTSEALYSSKCHQLWKGATKGDSGDPFVKWHMEVMGGDEPEKVFLPEAQNFSEWMRSAKRHPEVVSYSLTSLHTLLKRSDPRRKALKQAISDYITERALRRSCDGQCPYNGFRSREDHCACMCHANDLHDNMCCARERGKARLRFYIRRAANLYGDDFSGTDGYVRVLFQGRAMRTEIIDGDNSPQWHETLDFGTVTLADRNTYKLEVWDSDPHEDDLLKRFQDEMKAGGTDERIGYLDYGHIEFSYTLECAPSLGGPSCQTYIPLKRPASSSRNTSPGLTTRLRQARDLDRNRQLKNRPGRGPAESGESQEVSEGSGS